MKPVALVLCGLVTIGAAVVYLDLRSARLDRADADARAAEQVERLAALDAKLGKIADRFDTIESRITTLENAPRLAAEPIADSTRGEVETIDPRLAAERDAKAAAKRELDDLLMKIVDPTTSHADSEALWQEIAEKGFIDAAIASLEERAKVDPSNPDLQVELAEGYLQKLFAAKNPIEQGGWAAKMDKCYDNALAVDDKHWAARFSKAVSYSFWPAITGKPQESVKHFEILRAQQESSGERRPEYAETYVLLGNLYKQQGKLDQAKAAYEKGLSLFPQHESLKTQAGSL